MIATVMPSANLPEAAVSAFPSVFSDEIDKTASAEIFSLHVAHVF
jgi:hypothetical protein